MALIEHLEKLRHFQKVSTFSSINEAAKSTGVSQAGLSKSIASLETALDVQLFTRSRAGLVLTKEGSLLLETAKEILALANTADLNLRSLKATRVPDRVHVGMYDSIAVYFFPQLREYMKTIYPDVELELIADTSENLASRLERNEIDIAIGINLDSKRSTKSEFSLLFEDDYGFYISRTSSDPTTSTPLIFHPEATDSKGVSNKKHLSPLLKNRFTHQAFNYETIKTLTSLGLGVGVIPTQVAKPLIQNNELKSVSIAKFPKFFGKHSIGFLASTKFLVRHREFADDLYRLGQRWAKT